MKVMLTIKAVTETITMKRKMLSAACVGIALVLGLGACQTRNEIPQSSVNPGSLSLVSGDVLRITFLGVPELSQSQKIRPDGKISMPMIGEVQAAGKTPAKLQEELSRLYKPQLQVTEVVVTLDKGGIPVIVSGAVKTPTKIVLERPTTLLQALMEAGAFGGLGDLKRVHVVRLINGQQHTQILDMSSSIKGKPTAPFYLQDGDIIYVPERIF